MLCFLSTMVLVRPQNFQEYFYVRYSILSIIVCYIFMMYAIWVKRFLWDKINQHKIISVVFCIIFIVFWVFVWNIIQWLNINCDLSLLNLDWYCYPGLLASFGLVLIAYFIYEWLSKQAFFQKWYAKFFQYIDKTICFLANKVLIVYLFHGCIFVLIHNDIWSLNTHPVVWWAICVPTTFLFAIPLDYLKNKLQNLISNGWIKANKKVTM